MNPRYKWNAQHPTICPSAISYDPQALRCAVHDHMKSQMGISSDVGRSTYNVDSFSASLDILRSSDAIMPYSSKLSAWMMQKGFKALFIDENKLGNVGIYHKLGCDDEKVLSMIERIRQRV